MEYMGMAGCGGEACDLGAMIVVMLKCIGYDSGIYYLVYGHAYAALSFHGCPSVVTYLKSCDVVLGDGMHGMAGSK